MPWSKQQKIFQADGQAGWMHSHSQVPTILVGDGYLRVYFSTRPEPTVSQTTFVDLDLNDPSKILYCHEQPVLELGDPGSFDEFGIMPSSVIVQDDFVYLYYTGWSRGTNVPYLNAIGVAVSGDGGRSFTRLFPGPIVDRTPYEPYSAMSPYVIKHQHIWHMWYSSGVDWVRINNKYEPVYLIKYAYSEDGLHWQQTNKTCIPPKISNEANTRPCVIARDGKFHMWFCYRGSDGYREGKNSYRIGYATSTDLRNWERCDELAGIDVSESGWDSEMVEYPQIVTVNDELLMFYNGNEFGASGFGYARYIK